MLNRSVRVAYLSKFLAVALLRAATVAAAAADHAPAGGKAAAEAATADTAGESASKLRFATAFVQLGIGDELARAYVLGATWDWAWRKQWRFGTLTGFFEAAVGRWNTGKHGAAWTTQVAATPVFRWHPAGRAARWFGEVGVGGNLIVPLFRTGARQFSTEFNFGDHVAIGYEFGGRGQHALAVRVEHFSNAGINHPNPGENFLQLRYSYRF